MRITSLRLKPRTRLARISDEIARRIRIGPMPGEDVRARVTIVGSLRKYAMLVGEQQKLREQIDAEDKRRESRKPAVH